MFVGRALHLPTLGQPKWSPCNRVMGRFRSGQTGQTVNLLAYAFAGSNPALPTLALAASTSATTRTRMASYPRFPSPGSLPATRRAAARTLAGGTATLPCRSA